MPVPPLFMQGVYDVRNEAHGIKLGVQTPAPGGAAPGGKAGATQPPPASGGNNCC